MKVRTRIAPSPTGALHIGTARTTLFNYLFAKTHKGQFILRFEDTDRSRSTQESEKEIMEGLRWLGLNWDGKIYRQIERLDLYKKAAGDLKNKSFAYKKEGAIWCNVKAILDKFKMGYHPAELFNQETQNKKEGYLIKLPQKDLILGGISGVVEDFVIVRSNGIPTYHFAVVVDDEAMKITHVIRGQDHFPNTPKHYLLQKALGYKTPFYAHIPLTLAPDKTKLSKRHGAISISEYKNQGYLPEALINFMAFLGWNPKTTQEFFSLDELIKNFDIKDMNKSAAIFNIEKLNFFNHHYIQDLPLNDLALKCLPYLIKAKLISNDKREIQKQSDFILKVVSLFKGRLAVLSEIANLSKFLFKKIEYDTKILVFKKSDQKKTLQGLEAADKALEALKEKDWESKDKINNLLLKIVEKEGLSNGDVFWPIRVALSGLDKSPSPVELLWALGKEESLKRIKRAIKLLSVTE